MNKEEINLPSGKNRLDKNDLGHRRMTIGQGEHASIYRMLDGPFEDLVCRSPIESCSGLNTEKEGLLRFRSHQIAYALFPNYVLDVRAFNAENREMFSVEVERSKQNLRDCTRVGLLRRRERVQEPLEDEVLEVVKKMKEVGISVEDNRPNVSIVRSNQGLKICFFEVLGVDPQRIRSWLHSEPSSEVDYERVQNLLKLYEFEKGIEDIDLMILLRDRQERAQILSEEGVSELDDLYDRELNLTILTGDF